MYFQSQIKSLNKEISRITGEQRTESEAQASKSRKAILNLQRRREALFRSGLDSKSDRSKPEPKPDPAISSFSAKLVSTSHRETERTAAESFADMPRQLAPSQAPPPWLQAPPAPIAAPNHIGRACSSDHSPPLRTASWHDMPLLPADPLLPFPKLALPSSHRRDSLAPTPRPFEPPSPPLPPAVPPCAAGVAASAAAAAAAAADPFHGDWPHW
jgi:hypothetical protein